MKLTKEDPILIIGGGVAGISLAAALKHAGFTHVRVFDKRPDNSVPAVPVSCGPNVLLSLRSMFLSEMVQQSGVPWQQMSYRHRDGKVFRDFDMAKISNPYHYQPLSVSLPSLVQIFKRELSPEAFVYGEELISYTQTSKDVEAHFLSGRSEKGALLIGADGVDSRVRLQMKGSSEQRRLNVITYAGLIDNRVLNDRSHEVFTNPYVEYKDDDARIAVFPVNDKETGVRISLNLPEDATGPMTMEEAKKIISGKFSDWEGPLGEVAGWAAQSNLYAWEQRDREPVSGWYEGRVVLTGDAIHPSVPVMGLGTGLAIESSLLLAECLDQNIKKIERAFKNYEQQRRKRTTSFNKFAYRTARMLAARSSLTSSIRNAVSEYLPGGYSESALYNTMNADHHGPVSPELPDTEETT